ncbi:MAG: hypothetical protein RL291_258, partial [Pseudomonadota bacterium]
VWRQATRDAIFQAYRERAVMACQNERRLKQFGVAPVAWQPSPTQTVEVGKRGVDVALWQVDDPRWADRFKRTTVRLVAQDGPATLACSFDVTTSSAVLRQI